MFIGYANSYRDTEGKRDTYVNANPDSTTTDTYANSNCDSNSNCDANANSKPTREYMSAINDDQSYQDS